MDIVVASSTDEQDVLRNLCSQLVSLGHTVSGPATDPRTAKGADLVVVLAAPVVAATALLDLLGIVGEAGRLDIPMVGIQDVAREDLPADLDVLTIDGGWQLATTTDELATVLTRRNAGHTIAGATTKKKILTVDVGELRDRVRSSLTDEPPVPEPAAPEVFLSYSRRDEHTASVLVRDLQDHGAVVWLDKSNIPGGESWQASVEAGIARADVVVVLLSSQVVEKPEWVQAEIDVARSAAKRIVPVLLEPLTFPPPGFRLVLAGLQTIGLHHGYDDGLAKLVDALGVSREPAHQRSALGQARRLAGRARLFARKHELGRKAMTAGGVLLAAGAAAVVATASADARNATESGRVREAARQESRRRYVRRVDELLGSAIAEMHGTSDLLQLNGEIDVVELRRDVRPRMMRLIGQLEAVTPTDDSELAERHVGIVRELESLTDEFDGLLAKLDRGDTTGYENAVRRLNDAWSGVFERLRSWLHTLVASTDEKPA